MFIMQWWFWPLGTIIICLIWLALNRWTSLKRFKIKILDIIPIPMWVALHFTMGYRFGTSWILWFMLIWFVFGEIITWVLLRRKWQWTTFWHKYWEWTGLVGATLLLIITVIGFFYH